MPTQISNDELMMIRAVNSILDRGSEQLLRTLDGYSDEVPRAGGLEIVEATGVANDGVYGPLADCSDIQQCNEERVGVAQALMELASSGDCLLSKIFARLIDGHGNIIKQFC